MSSEIFETMTKRNIGTYVVRIWRSVDSFKFGDAEVFESLQRIEGATQPDTILDACKAIPNIAAVEIINSSGQGAVWYKEWP